MKYTIEVSTIEEHEYDETDYKWIDEKTGAPSEYGNPNAVKEYYKTGKKLLRTDTKHIFEQTVGELDMAAVIRAVNNL